MYSKNDYRYYLEDQLMHSDDFLAHYGVKGMKWKQHIARTADNYFDAQYRKHNSAEYDMIRNYAKHPDKKGNMVKNTKHDMAAIYANRRAYELQKKAKKRTKKIKNKTVRKYANKAINKTYNTYDNLKWTRMSGQ